MGLVFPLPRAAAGRAVAVNKALVRRFAAFGADPAAVDMSRILRVVGTTNTKSGERAEILWLNECDGRVRPSAGGERQAKDPFDVLEGRVPSFAAQIAEVLRQRHIFGHRALPGQIMVSC